MTKDQLQAQALNEIGNQSHVAVEIGTGGGKTLLALKHINMFDCDLYLEYLVVVPRNSIIVEWQKQAKEHGYQHLLDKINFVTYRSLNKAPMHYATVYLDECHSLKFSHDEWLEQFPGKIIGLTGTYPKAYSSEKGLMCSKYCKKIFDYSVDDAIDDMLLNDYQIFVHLLKLGTKHNLVKKNKKGGQWKTSEYKDYQYYTKGINEGSPYMQQKLRILRMKAMQSYSTKIEYAKHILKHLPYKVLVFANTKEQADYLCKHSYHSGNKNSEANLQLFAEDYIKELSCVDQLSEGKSIPNLKCGIILHAFSNERLTRQRIGRFLRLNPQNKSYIHILCYENSIDLQWVKNSLKSFDPKKIKYYKHG